MKIIGTQFSDVVAKLSGAKELSKSRSDWMGDETFRTFDLDGDGKADATELDITREIITASGSNKVTRREVSFLDAKGRPVDTFTSGTRQDPAFGAVETGKVWSHTHVDRDPITGLRTETYERANNVDGELKERVTTVWNPSTMQYVKGHVDADRNNDGTLETSYDFTPE